MIMSLEDVLHQEVGWLLGMLLRSLHAPMKVVVTRAVLRVCASFMARVNLVHALQVGDLVE